MKKIWTFLLLSAVLLLSAAAENDNSARPVLKKAEHNMLAPYSYVRNAAFDSAHGSFNFTGWAAVPLDLQMYEAADDSYGNIRVTTKDGFFIPFLVYNRNVFKTIQYGVDHRAVITSFRYDAAANQAHIGCRLPDNSGPLTSVRIETDRRRFNKQLELRFDNGVRVSGLSFVNAGDYLKYEQQKFPFKAVTASNVELVISNFVERTEAHAAVDHQGIKDSFTEKTIISEHLRIYEIIFTQTCTKTQWRSAPLLRFHPGKSEVRKAGPNVTTFVWHSRHVPVRELSISSASPHYQREATIRFYHLDGEPGKTERRLISFHNVTLVPGFTLGNLDEIRADEIELQVQDGDNAPLQEVSMTILYPDKVLLMDAADMREPEAMVYYGGSGCVRPSYDLARYLRPDSVLDLKICTLEPDQHVNPYSAGGENMLNWGKYVLYIVIALAAVGLAVLCFRMMSHLKPEECE